MTPAEKWNTAAPILDLIVAVALMVAGVVVLCLRKKIRAAQAARVVRGELSPEAAQKLVTMITWCGIGGLAVGACLAVAWALGG